MQIEPKCRVERPVQFTGCTTSMFISAFSFHSPHHHEHLAH